MPTNKMGSSAISIFRFSQLSGSGWLFPHAVTYVVPQPPWLASHLEAHLWPSCLWEPHLQASDELRLPEPHSDYLCPASPVLHMPVTCFWVCSCPSSTSGQQALKTEGPSILTSQMLAECWCGRLNNSPPKWYTKSRCGSIKDLKMGRLS